MVHRHHDSRHLPSSLGFVCADAKQHDCFQAELLLLLEPPPPHGSRLGPQVFTLREAAGGGRKKQKAALTSLFFRQSGPSGGRGGHSLSSLPILTFMRPQCERIPL